MRTTVNLLSLTTFLIGDDGLLKFQSELTFIPGISEKLKERLLRNFGSLKRVGQASIEELRPFVGQKQAERILEHFRQQREPEESGRTEQHPPATSE